MKALPQELCDLLDDLYGEYEDAVKLAFENFDFSGVVQIEVSVKYLGEKEGE